MTRQSQPETTGLTTRLPRWPKLTRRSTQNFLTHIPLRVQLVVVLLGLSALALLLFGATAVGILRAQLIGQVDQKLHEATANLAQVGRVELDDSLLWLQPSAPKAETLAIATIGNRSLTNDHTTARLLLGSLPAPSTVATPPGQAEAFSLKVENGSRWRVLISQIVVQDTGPTTVYATLTTARDLADVDDTVHRLITLCVSTGLLLLLLLAGLGFWLIRASLRPLVQVEHTAAAIASGDLSRRVPHRDPRTEVGRLGAALNGMLARIENAFAAQTASETQARASEELMRRFVADASHELRTPLTSISGFAQLHSLGGVPDDQLAEVMQRIRSEAQRMGLLVEDLLLLARLDQQRPLERSNVNLSALAADVVESQAALAQHHHLRMSPPSTQQQAPVVVSGDEHRLRQVMLNLVTNAVRHTPAGSTVIVDVTTDQPQGDHPSTAIITVTDDGPGLTPQQAKHVFDRFYRADPSRTRSAGGSGLGLSIVAAIVAAHHGSITVHSPPEGGATFTVGLPLDTADTTASAENTSQA